MAKSLLSDASVRSLKPPASGQRSYWDAKLPTFGVRVSQGGSKTFVINRQNTLITIGRFPIISLSDARAEARRLLAEYTLGKVRPQSITLTHAVELFLAEKAKGRRPRTVADLKDRLHRHFSMKGQLADVTHGEIVRRLSKIPTPQEHNAALRVGKTFFTWAMNRRYISDNPFRGISPHTVPNRSRVLTDEELCEIWRVCDQRCTGDPTSARDATFDSDRNWADLGWNFCRIIQLLILTGQRRGEVAALQSSWITADNVDKGANEAIGSADRRAHTVRRAKAKKSRNEVLSQSLLTIPSIVTKNRRDHAIPLGFLASDIVAKQVAGNTTPLLFPARGSQSTPYNGWSKSKAALDRMSGVTDWTLHDIRRTYRTIHARIGTPPHIAERLVNHVSSRSTVEQIYDRHSYLSEMRKAVDSYEKFLNSIGVG